MTATSRRVDRIVLARETPEGVGVTVRRSIGGMSLRNLDPFLLLDHFKVAKGSGFSGKSSYTLSRWSHMPAEHPHRGFSTVTYMLDGMTQHEDFKGHVGVLKPGVRLLPDYHHGTDAALGRPMDASGPRYPPFGDAPAREGRPGSSRHATLGQPAQVQEDGPARLPGVHLDRDAVRPPFGRVSLVANDRKPALTAF
jgi:hypothetical protein